MKSFNAFWAEAQALLCHPCVAGRQKKLYLQIGLSVFYLLLSVRTQAQDSLSRYDPARYRDEPVWIEMMDDPNANFYETLRAFREFWQGYELPGEPDELERKGRFKRDIGMKENKPKVKPAPAPELPRRIIDGNDFSFEVKRFKGWLREVQPWVQEDGRILTLEERQKIIDQQQRELRAVESEQRN